MTARQKIVDRINEVGFVDNFWCIDNRVTTRLGAVIHSLTKQGWEFDGHYLPDTKNWAYYPTKRPESLSNSQIKPIAEGLGLVYKVHNPVWTHNDPA